MNRNRSAENKYFCPIFYLVHVSDVYSEEGDISDTEFLLQQNNGQNYKTSCPDAWM